MDPSFRIGICAYKEEHNIERLLKRVLEETNRRDRVLVVGRGNKTKEIIQNFSDQYKRVGFIEDKGKGKPYAMNLILQRIEEGPIIFVTGDNLPRKESIRKLKEELRKGGIKAVSGKLIPQISNFWCDLFWNIHNRLCLKKPRMTQFYGLKEKIVEEVPDTLDEDAYIQSFLEDEEISYLTNAKSEIYDRKNKSLVDFFQKRRRWRLGHLQLKKIGKDTSFSLADQFKVVLSKIKDSPFCLPELILVVFLEALTSLLAHLDIYLKEEAFYDWKSSHGNP